jgi:hypothetical protein
MCMMQNLPDIYGFWLKLPRRAKEPSSLRRKGTESTVELHEDRQDLRKAFDGNAKAC